MLYSPRYLFVQYRIFKNVFQQLHNQGPDLIIIQGFVCAHNCIFKGKDLSIKSELPHPNFGRDYKRKLSGPLSTQGRGVDGTDKYNKRKGVSVVTVCIGIMTTGSPCSVTYTHNLLGHELITGKHQTFYSTNVDSTLGQHCANIS